MVYETRGSTRDLKESDPRSKVENVITASADEQAGVKLTAKETPAPAGTDGAPERPTPSSLATPIAGIAAALAVVTLGLWYFRRK